MPIVTLTWDSQGAAYGPRGTRYQLVKVGARYDVLRYTPEQPGGVTLVRGVPQGDAMLAAQSDCENVTQAVGIEADALATGGSSRISH